MNCRRIVSSGVWCEGCCSFFHVGDCSGVENREICESHWLCRICSRDRKIGEQEEKISALQAELEEAKEDLERLRGEKGKERWEVATGHRRNRNRTFSDSFVVNVENRFHLLSQLETNEPQVDVGVDRSQQTFKNCLKNKKSEVDVRKKKVLLLGSSHGRGVGQVLQSKLGSGYQVTSFFKPSASLGQVTEDVGSLCKDFTKEDTVVIVGGAGNSIDRDSNYSIESDLVKIVSATKHTGVELVSVLERHDRPHLNSSVGRVNLELERLLGSGMGSHIGVVPVKSIRRWDYTRHGLHLNRKGKGKLSGLIAKKLMGDTITCGKIPVVISDRTAVFLG